MNVVNNTIPQLNQQKCKPSERPSKETIFCSHLAQTICFSRLNSGLKSHLFVLHNITLVCDVPLFQWVLKPVPKPNQTKSIRDFSLIFFYVFYFQTSN